MIEHDSTGDQTQSARHRQLGWHLLALVLICTVRFAANHDSLLSGVDGSYATFSQYPGVLFTDPLSILSISPYFGFGINFPGPSPFIDPFGLVLYATGSVVAAYVLLAVIMFLSIYAFARALGLSIAAALASGWLMVVAVLPLGQATVPLIEIASLIHPSSTYVIAMFCMVAALFLLVGRCDVRWNAGMAAGFLVVIAASWINNLTFMVLALPYTAIALAIFTVTASSWREGAWKAGCMVLAFGLYGWLGVGAFVDSFTAFSPRLDSMIGHSSGLMAHERRYLLSLMNNLYYGNFLFFFLAGGPLLGWVGFAGLIHGTLLGNWRWRLLCLATLGITFALTIISSEYSLPGIIWPWAAPGYFERACYPVYVIAAVLLVQQVFVFGRTTSAGLLARISPRLDAAVQNPRRYQRHVLVFTVVLAVFVSLIGTGPKGLAREMTAMPVTFPPVDSPWRKIAALVPVEKGQPFKGWFADLTQPNFEYHVQVWRSGGGTLFTIPAEDTLTGAGMRRLEMMGPIEKQFALLGAYGLAYVHWSALAAGDDFEPRSDIMPGLFRIRAANLGDFSPTYIIKVADFDAFERMIPTTAIDWRRSVVLDPATADQVGSGLVAAKRVSPPVVVTNGLTLEAETEGRSLLLLPRQFSNCYVWRPDPGTSDKVTIVRANMLQVALLFEGNIRGKLDYVYRWGGDARCRAQDPAQARALGIRPHPIAEGRYGPIGRYILLPAQNRAAERNIARAKVP